MPTPSNLDGVLVQWGDRLFYPANRTVRAHTPKLTGAGTQERAHAIRQRIHAIVVRRAPPVMVTVKLAAPWLNNEVAQSMKKSIRAMRAELDLLSFP